MRLHGGEHRETLTAAINCANSLHCLLRYGEARALLRRIVPKVRRVLGESNEVTIRTRSFYADTVCRDTGATLDDLSEAVTTLEDTEQIARRVLGGTHPTTKDIEATLQNARAALRARDTPQPSSSPPSSESA